jgi:hypothetical protein
VFNFVDPRDITWERASQIRAWRCDEGYTWRAVAQAACDSWRTDLDLAGNQLYGRELCQFAAKKLGEDPDLPPWN